MWHVNKSVYASIKTWTCLLVIQYGLVAELFTDNSLKQKFQCGLTFHAKHYQEFWPISVNLCPKYPYFIPYKNILQTFRNLSICVGEILCFSICHLKFSMICKQPIFLSYILLYPFMISYPNKRKPAFMNWSCTSFPVSHLNKLPFTFNAISCQHVLTSSN